MIRVHLSYEQIVAYILKKLLSSQAGIYKFKQ